MGRYCLSIHAAYACGHSGACCTSGWPIPVEPLLLAAVRRKMLPLDRPAFETAAAADGNHVPILATSDAGACVFFEPHRGRLCAIHRTIGPALLPAACRNFPRVALRDPRGVFVTLSHYCPTAARMLLQDCDITIVNAPPGLTLDDQVEGLDATGVLPPLLRPGMLMNLAGYTSWEHEAIATLNDHRFTAATALGAIGAATAAVTCWRPGGESLPASIEAAFARCRAAAGVTSHAAPATLERAKKRFLAAHAFASWSSYQAGGISAVVRSLQSALERLDAEMRVAHAGKTEEAPFITAVRRTDFHLRHTATDVCSGSLSPLRRD